jgi:hypothetical protein
MPIKLSLEISQPVQLSLKVKLQLQNQVYHNSPSQDDDI